MTDPRPSILCVDDDRDVVEVVQAILEDEGYAVSSLYDLTDDALLRTIGRLEPDAVMLDGFAAASFDASWDLAAGIRNRSRPVPVVMFTAHAQDVAEAEGAISDRAKQAGFAAILAKPFTLDDLVETVARAVGRSEPFDRSRGAEESRTRELVRALKARGASDVRPSKMREWALFRDHEGAWRQLYWWQGRGVYQLGRYQESGELVMIGQFIDREAALELALPSS
jgi:CheY-like chemotaxis protein